MFFKIDGSKIEEPVVESTINKLPKKAIAQSQCEGRRLHKMKVK